MLEASRARYNAAAASPATCPDSIADRTESLDDTVNSDLPTQDDTAPAAQRPQLPGTAVFSSFVAKPPSDFSQDQELVCQDCKMKVVPGGTGVRLRSKTKKIYQCGNCNSACTVLSYALGGWPSEEFQAWDPETKVNFFRSGLKGGNIKRAYAQTCAKKHIERRINRDTGEMRPLQYWVKLGYDENRLKCYTPKEDQTFSEQLGWQFRVNVNTAISETHIEKEMQDILSKMATRTAAKANFKEAKVAARKLQRRLSKSDSSTSMSSSTSPVKKKKQKKQKKLARQRKETKEEDKQAKVRKRDEEKQAKELTGPSLRSLRPTSPASPLKTYRRLHR